MEKEIAILVASGLSTRMQPLSNIIPKPLIKLHGKPMIETSIEGLRHRGVTKIYIIVGYKKEKFNYFQKKYDNIIFVENMDFEKKNNMSSGYALGDILGSCNCFLCDADLVIEDMDIYNICTDESCFFGSYVSGKTDDWFYETEGDCVVKIKKGGANGYNLSGISSVTKDDAAWVRDAVDVAYKEGKRDSLFWEEIISKQLIEKKITINVVKKGQVTELDTVEELQNFDPTYRDL